jgi:anti-sigma factor RsiW
MVRDLKADMSIDPCPSEQELSRYYDGQLPYDRRDQIASHLAQCAACRELVAHWTTISRVFREAPHQRLSAIATARVYRRMDEVLERGLVRLAWVVSGLAASVLLAGSMWLMRADTPAAPVAVSPPPWVGVAYASDIGQNQREPATPAAEWYLASSAGSSDELP